MTGTPTPADVAAAIHRRIPDGTRALAAVRPRFGMRLHVAKHQLTCFTNRVAAWASTEPPETCQRVIVPGLWFLAYRTVHPQTKVVSKDTYPYCAPCAVREFPQLGIREPGE